MRDAKRILLRQEININRNELQFIIIRKIKLHISN